MKFYFFIFFPLIQSYFLQFKNNKNLKINCHSHYVNNEGIYQEKEYQNIQSNNLNEIYTLSYGVEDGITGEIITNIHNENKGKTIDYEIKKTMEFNKKMFEEEDDYDNDDSEEKQYEKLRNSTRGFLRYNKKTMEAKKTENENESEYGFEVIKNSNFTFKDIGGYDKIKTELLQVADILKNYTKYEKYNVRTPKGLILEGPPGNGKTLMAKCFSGEANSSFIAVSGSEFIEKYVGVGASRIRDLFKLAEKNKPCIIFIDEIDAVGRKRGNDVITTNSEKDQTLNQLLVSLDGYKSSNGIFLVGATNRVDLLDSALIRPGRVDKNIYIGNPDANTRREIIQIHCEGKPIDKTVNIDDMLTMTSGFSGAQIENLLNEAMLHALRENREKMMPTDLEFVNNRIVSGWQSTESIFSDDVLDKIVIHEMGHAITGILMKDHAKLIKVCINLYSPKSPGYTIFENNDEDVNIYTKKQLLSHIVVLFGGRVAEEFFYGESITTGAKQDLEQIRTLTHQMINEYGMGKKQVYPHLSDESKHEIDQETNMIIMDAYKKAYFIISFAKDLIKECAVLLKEKKILKEEEITALIDKKYMKLYTIFE